MSYYDDSSLFVAPNGYKTSVLFAQKPMDANGQLAFTRSNSTATRVGPDGFIEKVRTNLLERSSLIVNWQTAQLTVDSTAVADPFGGTNAGRYSASGVASAYVFPFNAPSVTSGTTYTGSYYVKDVDANYVQLTFGTGGFGSVQYQNFDLTNGTKGSGAGSTSTITSVGNGWYRITLTATATATSTAGMVCVVIPSASSARLATANAGQTFEASAYQMEVGDIATDYIPTTTAAVSVGPVANIPRIDYLGGGCGKLLLEPQRTNLITFSENFDNAAWTKTNTTITANDEVSPDGYTNADKITDNANNTQHRVYQGISVTSGTSYTASIFVKNDDKGDFAINFTASGFASTQIVFNLINGTVTSGTGTIQDYGNGWYRISATAAANVTGSGLIGFNLGNGGGYVGSGQSVFIYGAQIEAASYATSYINTLAAAVTRGADACSKTGISSLIGQTEGVIFIEFEKSQSGYNYYSISDGTTNNWIFIGQDADNPDRLRAYVKAGTVTTDIFVGPVANGTYKMAMGYKNNDVVFYVNGTLRGTDTSTTIPSGLSAFALTNLPSSSSSLTNKVSQAILFKTRLSNSELASLTTL
jgi:hypothetical protein